MIDLDRLEQRLDLALEAELRRHIGLDDEGPAPAPPSERETRARAARPERDSRRERRRRPAVPPVLNDFPGGETAYRPAPAPPSRPEPSIPAWPPSPGWVGSEPDEASAEAAWPEPEAAWPEPEPEPAPPAPQPVRNPRARRPKPPPEVTARQPFERRADRPAPRRPERQREALPEGRKPSNRRPERLTPTAGARSAFEKKENRPPGLLQLRLRERKRTGSPLRPEAAAPAVAQRETRPPVPAPSAAPGSDENLQWHARQVVELIGQGRIDQADEHISAHAALAAKGGGPLARRDAAAWAVMRALVDGRHRNARHQLEEVLRLGEEAGDAAAADVHTWQRFWLLIEWGSEAELDELLDLCRQRAYFDSNLHWRAGLTLLLARMGYAEESAREFDMVMEKAFNGLTHDADWLDIVTNAGEAAAVLGDEQRALTAYGALGQSPAATVIVGRAWVCKGSTARVLGLLAATLARPSESDRHFGVAMGKHRDMEALPLLARTCTEWGLSVATREPDEADQHLDEGFELASRLRMTALADTARAGLDTLRQPIVS